VSPPFRSNIAGAPHNLEALPAEPLPNFLTIALARAGINPLAHFVLHPSGKSLNSEAIGDGRKAAFV
jgi:hypothetical protein